MQNEKCSCVGFTEISYYFSYAKIDFHQSPPIVPFMETIVPPPTVDMVNEDISDQNQSSKVKDDDEDKDEEILGTYH